MTDEELFAGLEESVQAAAAPQAAPKTASNGAAPAPKGPPSLAKAGIGRGGIIRNESTKRRTQLHNPLTNLKKPSGKSTSESTPEDQLKAEHPALAFPSVLTGMDLDTRKPDLPADLPAKTPVADDQAATWQPPPEADDIPMTTTVAELLRIAAVRGTNGIYHVGKPEWLVAVQIRSPDLLNYLRSKSQA